MPSSSPRPDWADQLPGRPTPASVVNMQDGAQPTGKPQIFDRFTQAEARRQSWAAASASASSKNFVVELQRLVVVDAPVAGRSSRWRSIRAKLNLRYSAEDPRARIAPAAAPPAGRTCAPAGPTRAGGRGCGGQER